MELHNLKTILQREIAEHEQRLAHQDLPVKNLCDQHASGFIGSKLVQSKIILSSIPVHSNQTKPHSPNAFKKCTDIEFLQEFNTKAKKIFSTEKMEYQNGILVSKAKENEVLKEELYCQRSSLDEPCIDFCLNIELL